jgi:hypothetical protein
MRVNIKLPIEWDTTIGSEVHRATEVLRTAHIQTEGTIECATEAVGTITLQIGAYIPKVLKTPSHGRFEAAASTVGMVL